MCNVHYADFWDLKEFNNDILPIHFKRPSSYLQLLLNQKEKSIERRPPPRNFTRSRATDHQKAELQGEHLCSLQLPSRPNTVKSLTVYKPNSSHIRAQRHLITQNKITETCDSGLSTYDTTETQQITETSDSGQLIYDNTETSEQILQNTEISDCGQSTFDNTETPQSTERSDSGQSTYDNAHTTEYREWLSNTT